jgi:hypothetical protein
MKKSPIVVLAVVVAALTVRASAAHPIIPTGLTYVYSQDFNGLATTGASGNVAASPSWGDNATVPNWWFYAAGGAVGGGVFAGSNFPYWCANGATTSTFTLNSQGSAGSADRAFSAPSTSAKGEQSGIVIFQNASGRSMDLTRIQYNGEVLRTNTTSGAVESIFVWYRKAATEAEALTLATAAATPTVFPAAVSTSPNAFYISGWTQINAARWTFSTPASEAQVNVSQPRDANGLSGIRMAPGEFLALRFSNINDNGMDALMGVDDVRLTFSTAGPFILAAVSAVVRSDSGTPLNPDDDTVGFTLTVDSVGAVGPGWTMGAPAVLASAGVYGVPKLYTGIPISEFSGAMNAIEGTVVDSVTASLTASFSVPRPGCTLVPMVRDFTYDDNGTALDAADDVVTYKADVAGSFTGATYTISGAGAPMTVAYGSSPTVVAGSGTQQDLTFTDSADPGCTAALRVNHAAIMGTNSLSGSPKKLLSLPTLGARSWLINSTTRQATRASAPASTDDVVLSEIVDLSDTEVVYFTAKLDTTGGNPAGFSPSDQIRIDLIIDGATTAPVSMLGSYDVNRDGRLAGPELLGAGATFSYDFRAMVPAAANRAQIRITGNSNSAAETFVVKDIDVTVAPPAIVVTVSSVTFQNFGTVTADDDTFTGLINITPINTKASPGWTTDLAASGIQLSGLYSDPNPISVTVKSPNFRVYDALDPSVFGVVDLSSGAGSGWTGGQFEGSVRNENGPELADDTVTYTTSFRVNGTVGPRFVLQTAVGTAVPSNDRMPSTYSPRTVVVSPAPTHGPVWVGIGDASYPLDYGFIYTEVNVPRVPVTHYILGKTNLGTIATDWLTAPGVPTLAWANYPGLRKTVSNGISTSPETIRSEVIDLTSVSGVVQFRATLRAAVYGYQRFTESDVIQAKLILNGDANNIINLVAPYDRDASGVLEGEELNYFPELTSPAGGTASFSLKHTIPNAVSSVQLEVSVVKPSSPASILLEDVFLEVDRDADGMPDVYEERYDLNVAAPDRNGDLDGDGQSNYEEYLAGTSPDDPVSRFEVASIKRMFSGRVRGNAYRLEFPSVAGRTYRLEYSPDGTTWTSSGASPDTNQFIGTGDVMVREFSESFFNPGRLFFRIGLAP